MAGTRPNSYAREAHGETSMRSNMRRLSGSTGLTTAGYLRLLGWKFTDKDVYRL